MQLQSPWVRVAVEQEQAGPRSPAKAAGAYFSIALPLSLPPDYNLHPSYVHF